jgi:hypothetical protein
MFHDAIEPYSIQKVYNNKQEDKVKAQDDLPPGTSKNLKIEILLQIK